MNEYDYDFELDPDDMIDEYASEVNLVLSVLSKIDNDLGHSVITNTSKFSDFDLTDEELDEVSMEIGVNIVHSDLLVFAAKKLRGED